MASQESLGLSDFSKHQNLARFTGDLWNGGSSATNAGEPFLLFLSTQKW
jgi:hypothetical protein